MTGLKSKLRIWQLKMTRNHRFPHLLPVDVKLWEQFLAANPNRYSVIDYDVRVGQGRPMPDLATANLRRMATDLSMRRIDAIGHNGNNRTVIEITHTAGLKAVGQMIAYKFLYREKFPGNYQLDILLVAGQLESDIFPVLASSAIPYWTPETGLVSN